MKFRCGLFLALPALLALHALAGSITVKIEPEAAVAGGAMWRVDGGSWLPAGETAQGLFHGYHNAVFRPVAGWAEPKTLTVLCNGGTVEETVTYERAASLNVTLTPGIGLWRVDGGPWRKSGEPVTDIRPGSHTVSYSSVDGCSPLSAEQMNLQAGQSLVLERSYPNAASLQVNLSRPDAKWKINEGAWQPAGFCVTNLAAGEYTIRYSVSPGWSNPPVEKLVLKPGAECVISREYPAAPFVVSFSLVPSEGKYRLNQGPWIESGKNIEVPAGTYRVDFLPLPGMDTPVPQTIHGKPGFSFGTTARYTSNKPTLCIVVPGEWRVDGGAWKTHRDTVTLEPGQHLIEYRYDNEECDPLPPETITLVRGEPRTISRGYRGKAASLKVEITPSEGKWRLESGVSWWPSEYRYQFGGSRTFTIRYAPLSGYETPAEETVEVKAGENVVIRRKFKKL